MKLHLPTKLKAALLAAVLSAGSYPALGVTTAITKYTYTAADGTQQTIDFNGDIWTWNNYRNNGKDGQALSDTNCLYTKYGTTTEVTGRTDMDPDPNATVPFFNYFFNGSETDLVGNTLQFSGADSDIRLSADWHHYAWIGGLITETSANDITYTFGRTNDYTGFKLKGGHDVNLLLNSSFTLLTQTNNTNAFVSVEKGGAWTVASGKTFTITTTKTTLATDQAVNINGSGTVAIGSDLETRSGSSITVAAESNSIFTVSGATTNAGTLQNDGGTMTFTGNVTNTGTITNNGTMSFSGEITNTGSITVAQDSTLTIMHSIANSDSGTFTLNGTLKLAADFIVNNGEHATTFHDIDGNVGDNGYASGFILVSGGATKGSSANVVDANGNTISVTIGEDGSLITGEGFQDKSIYFQNTGHQEFTSGNFPAKLSMAAGASAELAGVLECDIDIYGDGTFTAHFKENGEEARRLNLGNFSGKLRVEGTATIAENGSITQQARGLLYTGNVIGDNVTVELGTRGQIVMTNRDTFANDIIIDSNVDTSVTDALKSRIYANINTSGTLTGNINLNGKTLYKEGAGTLNITGKKAIDSLLEAGKSGASTSTLIMEGGGIVQIARGTDSEATIGDNFGTNLKVSNSTLQLGISQFNTKTFTGKLTLTDGATLQQMDGGSRFEGDISLGGDQGGTVTLTADWGKGGINLAGNVSGNANVYLVGGDSADTNDGYQTINVSGSDNAFSGTYHVGVNSSDAKGNRKVHLIAGAEGSLAHATVNLAGGDKAVLELASASATVAGLNGTAGSSITSEVEGGATLTVNGGGSYAGSFNNVNLTKDGADSTLFIQGDAAINSLLNGSAGSTLTVNAGTVQIGGLGSPSSATSFATNLVVNGSGSTLKLATAQSDTKAFSGTLTLTDGATLQQMDGGSRFEGNISLGSNQGDTVTLTADWGKGGIELNGTVSGKANVYLVGESNGSYQTINVSGSDNTFSGTYHVGVDKNNTTPTNMKAVHLIAGAEGSLANATVNLAGGDKAVLSLASANATVKGLDGTAGSSIVTSATDGATLTVNGGGSYAGSFNNVNLTKQGAEATLTLAANSLTNAVSVEGGTLSLTAAGLTWGNDASVTVHSGNNAQLVMGVHQGITVTAHAPAVSTFAASDTNPAAEVTGNSINNADITLTSADDHISQTVSDSSITNNSGAKQTVDVGASLAEVYAENGGIDLRIGDAASLAAERVRIGDGQTVGVYQGTSLEQLETMASLSLNDLVTEGPATLNAKVTSLDTLTLGGVLTMGSGSSLSLSGTTIHLSDAFANSLATSLAGGAESFTLIEGIPGLSYEGATLDTSNLSGPYSYSLGQGTGGALVIMATAENAPEPTTATLSLLALAALAARRRRK